MYTQSQLRLLCKVAASINPHSIDEYSEDMVKEAKKEKPSIGRLGKKRKKHIRENFYNNVDKTEQRNTMSAADAADKPAGGLTRYIFNPEVLDPEKATQPFTSIKPDRIGNIIDAEVVSDIPQKMSWLKRLGSKGKLLAAIGGGVTLAGADTAGVVHKVNKNRQEASAREAEAQALIAAQEAAKKRFQDKRNLYSNIGTGVAGITGYAAGHGISSALGGNTATNILAGILTGAGTAYAGRKGTQWLMDKGYIG